MLYIYVKIISDRQVDFESLKYMKIHHIDKLFQENQLGPRVKFEHHLLNWQRKNVIFVTNVFNEMKEVIFLIL